MVGVFLHNIPISEYTSNGDDDMKKKKTLIISIALPLIIGGLASLISKNGFEAFQKIEQPPLTPPMWVFPVVWTILYILMGISCYLYLRDGGGRDKGLVYYGISLIFNFLWPIVFFAGQKFLAALILLLLLWVSVFLTLSAYMKRNEKAAYLQIPYLLWCTFAAYLNLAVFLLNK